MRLLAFAAVAMTVLAGCMLGPDYQRRRCFYRRNIAAEPPAPGREAVSLANLQWFQLFQDEALQALIRPYNRTTTCASRWRASWRPRRSSASSTCSHNSMLMAPSPEIASRKSAF